MLNRNSPGPGKTWQTATVAVLGLATVIGLFCVTSRPQAHADIDQKPVVKACPTGDPAQPLGPNLPSIDLVPKPSQRMTILLMGVDSNGRDTDPFLGTRSDTMMLVGIDPIENRVGVVSIPRDSRVRIPRHGVDKINSAHAFGGAELAMETVREAFGVPVDHYIEVDTGGLKKLFEILGPVEVLVEKEMHYTDHSAKLHVDLQPGLQTLTPEQAEEYVRFRHDARGDIGRIERQQWFIRQASKKFKDPSIVLKLPQLVCLGYKCIRTDLPIQDVLSLAAYAKDFPHERVVTAMLPGEGQMISGGSYWIPDALAGQAMFNKILGCSTSGIRDPLTPSVTDATISSASTSTETDTSVSTEPALVNPSEISLPEDSLPPSQPGLRYDFSKPASVAIKYPKGCEKLAEAMAENLKTAGFNVRYRWQIPSVECQHELLVQHSLRATDDETGKICQSIPEIKQFPVSLAIESRPLTDFTIIISPNSLMPSIVHEEPAPSTTADTNQLPIPDKKQPLNVSASAH